MTVTWQILTGTRKQCPKLLDTIATWFAEILGDSPLLEITALQAFEEIGKLRNLAVHPSKEIINEAMARRAFALFVESFSDTQQQGLIQALSKINEKNEICK